MNMITCCIHYFEGSLYLQTCPSCFHSTNNAVVFNESLQSTAVIPTHFGSPFLSDSVNIVDDYSVVLKENYATHYLCMCNRK